MAVKHKAQKLQRNPGRAKQADFQRAVWTTAYVTSLPDSSFAAIDESGRHLPYKDKDGKVDLPHLRNALARLNQTQISPELKAKASKKLEAAARQAGVGDYNNDSEGERMDIPTQPATQSNADDAALDPLALLQRAQDTFLEVADALGYDPLALVERAKKASADDEDEEDGDEDESDEDESEGEGEDEEEADVPPSKGKPGTGKFAPRFAKKREQEPALTRATREPVQTRATTVKAFTTPNLSEIGFAHITRIDKEKWEVEGVVSNEEIDTFGTVFDYDSMKHAVESRWHGNVREQHDPKLAVGKGVFVFCDDDKREVRVRARVSRGAPSTWAKVEDGVLCGFSIGAANAKTETRMIGDKSVPCYKDFDLAEISLVDAPSNPGAARSGLTLYRSATAAQAQEDIYADFLAVEEVPAPVAVAEPSTTPSAEAPAPAKAPVTEEEIAARVQEAEAALLRGDAFGVPQVTSGTPDINDTASGAPVVPSGDELDHIDSAMHTETGMTHVHSHAYSPSTVHMDQNAHTHGDGSSHAHAHLHGHVGHGSGASPHVHGHEHDHNFQRAAADSKGGSGFIGESDSRVQDYLNLVQREQTPSATPAALPAKAVETSGKPASAETIAGRTVVKTGNLVAMDAPMGQDGVMLAIATTPMPDRARVQVPEAERYGQRISGDTRTGMHEGALLILRTCGCPTCQDAIECYDPDNDGDDDVDESGDTDGDMNAMPRVQRAQLTRAVASIVQQQTQPITTQLRQIAARLAGVQTPELTRVQEQLDTVSAVLTALQGQVQQDSQLLRVIAEQEQPGAPVVRAADKRLAIHPTQQQGMTPFSDDQLAYLRRQNLLTQPTADQQTALAAEVFNRRNP